MFGKSCGSLLAVSLIIFVLIPRCRIEAAQAPRNCLNGFMAIWFMDGTTQGAESPLSSQMSEVSWLLVIGFLIL